MPEAHEYIVTWTNTSTYLLSQEAAREWLRRETVRKFRGQVEDPGL